MKGWKRHLLLNVAITKLVPRMEQYKDGGGLTVRVDQQTSPVFPICLEGGGKKSEERVKHTYLFIAGPLVQNIHRV